MNSIEEAIEEIKKGKLVIVTDDEARENEGDLVVAAELITPETVNFMLTQGRGILCVSLTEERCEELCLPMMEPDNISLCGTLFTVSVDLLGPGMSTGVAAKERTATICALVDNRFNAADFGRPGHIFPLKARKEGVLIRPGHTEAAADLARLAGLKPAGAIIEVMNEDGTMARLPQLKELAAWFDLKLVSIADLIDYRRSRSC